MCHFPSSYFCFVIFKYKGNERAYIRCLSGRRIFFLSVFSVSIPVTGISHGNFFLFFFLIIFFNWLEANYFTTFLWVLSYIDMNHPWSYMYSLSRSPLPPPSPPDPSGSSQCTSPEHLSHASNLGW